MLPAIKRESGLWSFDSFAAFWLLPKNSISHALLNAYISISHHCRARSRHWKRIWASMCGRCNAGSARIKTSVWLDSTSGGVRDGEPEFPRPWRNAPAARQGLHWIEGTGPSSKDLPEWYPPDHAGHWRFPPWRCAGAWGVALDEYCLDGTFAGANHEERAGERPSGAIG